MGNESYFGSRSARDSYSTIRAGSHSRDSRATYNRLSDLTYNKTASYTESGDYGPSKFYKPSKSTLSGSSPFSRQPDFLPPRVCHRCGEFICEC